VHHLGEERSGVATSGRVGRHVGRYKSKASKVEEYGSRRAKVKVQVEGRERWIAEERARESVMKEGERRSGSWLELRGI